MRKLSKNRVIQINSIEAYSNCNCNCNCFCFLFIGSNTDKNGTFSTASKTVVQS